MAHTLTLLKHESGYGGYLWTKVKYIAKKFVLGKLY